MNKLTIKELGYTINMQVMVNDAIFRNYGNYPEYFSELKTILLFSENLLNLFTKYVDNYSLSVSYEKEIDLGVEYYKELINSEIEFVSTLELEKQKYFIIDYNPVKIPRKYEDVLKNYIEKQNSLKEHLDSLN